MPDKNFFSKYGTMAVRILSNPAIIQDPTEIKDWEMVDLLRWCALQKHDILKMCHGPQSIAPESAIVKPEDFADWQDAVRVEQLVEQEQKRRTSEKENADEARWVNNQLLEIEHSREVERIRQEMQRIRTPKAEPNDEPKAEPPAFADLFVSIEAMEKALQAARAVGLINEANHWEYGGKRGAVVIFWDFLRDQENLLNPKQAENPLAIDSIAAFFGCKKSPADRTRRGAPDYRSELLRDLKAAVK